MWPEKIIGFSFPDVDNYLCNENENNDDDNDDVEDNGDVDDDEDAATSDNGSVLFCVPWPRNNLHGRCPHSLMPA